MLIIPAQEVFDNSGGELTLTGNSSGGKIKISKQEIETGKSPLSRVAGGQYGSDRNNFSALCGLYDHRLCRRIL